MATKPLAGSVYFYDLEGICLCSLFLQWGAEPEKFGLKFEQIIAGTAPSVSKFDGDRYDAHNSDTYRAYENCGLSHFSFECLVPTVIKHLKEGVDGTYLEPVSHVIAGPMSIGLQEQWQNNLKLINRVSQSFGAAFDYVIWPDDKRKVLMMCISDLRNKLPHEAGENVYYGKVGYLNARLNNQPIPTGVGAPTVNSSLACLANAGDIETITQAI